VRSVVGIITILATVIHFTFGCCLHPCHFGGCGDCVLQATEPATCEDCCHDHDHEEAAQARGRTESGRVDIGLAATSRSDGCHGCSGCDCAATTADTPPDSTWSPLACGIMATGDGAAITSFAVAAGRRPPDPSAHPCPSRHALFERLLI